MSLSGLSAPASPDPDVISGTSSRPESRSSISSSSMVDQAAESSRFSSNLDEIDKKSESGEVIGLDENAQSGGLLDDHKKMMLNSPEKEQDGEDSLEMVSDDDMEANESCKEHLNQKSPINMDPLKDTELDFEGDVVDEDSKKVVDEGRKSDEGDDDGEHAEGISQTEKEADEDEKEEGEELEEGEVSSEEDVGKHARMEPRPVCRFYSKGNCTWGSNCRFVHPGVLDKGNYNMFAPARPGAPHSSGMPYERSYDRPPAPSAGLPPAAGDWGNSSSRSAPPRSTSRHQQATETRTEAASGAESAWERGLRQAKEMLKKSSQRKETDIDFEEKKLNLGLGEEDLDKENDYYTRPASPIQHGDAPPPPFEELEPEPYSKYSQPSGDSRESRESREGRWQPPPSRYPPPPYPSHHPPQGYPSYPYSESRRGFPDPGLRDRDYYKSEGYDRPYYGYKPSDRDPYASSGKPPLPPPPAEKRWQEERYVEVVQAPAQRSRSDEWWDPWMRPRSPSGTAAPGGNSSAGKSAGGGGGGSGRRRSYSSGSSYSSSSSTSSSSSSSYSSSSRSSSRSSASSRSSSRSKSPLTSAKRRSAKKPRISERNPKSSKTQSAPVPKHKAPPSSSAAPPASSPPKSMAVKKPSQALEKQRSAFDKSPNRNREEWSSSSSRSRSRSRSPSVKNRLPPKSSSSLPVKTHGRSRSSSGSSSSSDDWDSSSRSSGEGRSRRTNRGRRDFAERKELRGGNTPPPPPLLTTKGKMAEPLKVVESKQQIKLTLKSTAPNLKKFSNKFNDDSDEDEEGGSREWEKEKAVPVSSPPSVSNVAQPSRKRSAESPPPTAPPSKVAAASTAPKGEKGSKKSTATRREELLKQLKAVEEAIARKRSKLTT